MEVKPKQDIYILTFKDLAFIYALFLLSNGSTWIIVDGHMLWPLNADLWLVPLAWFLEIILLAFFFYVLPKFLAWLGPDEKPQATDAQVTVEPKNQNPIRMLPPP